jgi:hypothetical protein
MVKNSWLKTGVVGALAALGIVSTTAGNRYGECWHTGTRLVYPRPAGVVFHADGWRFSRPGYRWAGDHPGRGYWRHGVWVTF